MKKVKREIDFWKWLEENKLKVSILGFVIIVVIPIFVSYGIKISNYIFYISGIDLSASGLSNSDWFAFWGSFSGGITTLAAVLWTLYQTNKNHLDLLKEQEKQRKLDVLPVLSLQPIRTATNFFALSLGNLAKEEKPKQVYIDKVQPEYSEYDVSEIFCILNSDGILFRDFLKEEETIRIKNAGRKNIVNKETGMTFLTIPDTVFLSPFWLSSVGNRVALNIMLEIQAPDGSMRCGHVLSLAPQDKVKLGFLIDLPNTEVPSRVGRYNLILRYSDIYSNKYRQDHEFNLVTDESNRVRFICDINVNQKDDI